MPKVTRGPSGGLSTAVPRQYRSLVTVAARDSGLPVKVIAAQIDDESSWDPRAVSNTGAEGIAQFEPSTWSTWGKGSPFDPKDAFPAYGKFMGSLLNQYNGNIRDALAAYNAGPGNLQAGYGYADGILAAAGLSDNASSHPIYDDPFRDVSGLSPERVDMGVDYSGSGPVYALGPGRITAVSNAWAGGVGDVGPGTWIVEKLSKGPLAGKQVYVAENIEPSVQVGDRVTTTTVIGRMTGQGAGIETGLAAPGQAGIGGETLAASLGQQDPGIDPGGWSSAAGVAYNNLLGDLHTPKGQVQSGGAHGTNPGWLKTIENGFLGLFGGAVSSTKTAGGVAGGLEDIAKPLSDIAQAVDWFLLPSNEIRLTSGIAGGIFVLMGIWAMTKVGGQVAGVDVPAPMALPLSIGLVGLGAVLLFVAFHNLPPEVNDFSSFVGHVTTGLRTGA